MGGYERDSDAYQRDSDAYQRDSDAYQRDSDAYQRDSDAYQRDSDTYQQDSEGLLFVLDEKWLDIARWVRRNAFRVFLGFRERNG